MTKLVVIDWTFSPPQRLNIATWGRFAAVQRAIEAYSDGCITEQEAVNKVTKILRNRGFGVVNNVVSN